MSDSSISFNEVKKEVKKICYKCYQDRRLWIMISIVLFASFISAVIIFQIDIGSNIIYGFILFWGLIFLVMSILLYYGLRFVKSFCKPKKKQDRDQDYLYLAGIIFIGLIAGSMGILVFLEVNYDYWIDLAIPQPKITTETLRSDCTIVEKITTKDRLNFFDSTRNRGSVTVTNTIGIDEKCEPLLPLTDEQKAEIKRKSELNVKSIVMKEASWRRNVETLDEDRWFEIINAKKEMDTMDCTELFKLRYADKDLRTPESIYNAHLLVDYNCDQDKDYYDLGYKR